MENPANRHYERLLFSTEGHTFPITRQFRRYPMGFAFDSGEAELFNVFPSRRSHEGISRVFNESCETLLPLDTVDQLHQLKPPLLPLPLSEFHLSQYLRAVDACHGDEYLLDNL